MTHPVDPAMFDAEFFPTPRAVAQKMLAKIDKEAEHFLEPSAGRGDLAEAIKGNKWDHNRRYVDCIEQSQELAAILQSKEFPVVGYDFLDYSGVCYYDAIVMNPPFSKGEHHLLKAWNFMHDGEIVCLLNEETIKNPHTDARKQLAAVIKENGGTVEYLGDCFSSAVRKTDVRVAMVYLKKTSDDDRVELWETKTEERKPDEDIGDKQYLAVRDSLGNMQHYYDAANEHMLKAFQHMRKAAVYLGSNDIHVGSEYDHIAALGFKNLNSARAEFVRRHRRDAWMKVFARMEFHRWLDKKQREELLRDVERNSNIPFTAENIKGTLENVFQQRNKLFEISVANVFDELTRYYKDNRFGGGGAGDGRAGWKTNDSYKVNKKLIFPYGCRFEYGSFGLRWDGAIDIYNDLDRVLCVLDGENFEKCYSIHRMMDAKFRSLGYEPRGYDNTVESQYFTGRFFKKGTVHLVFKSEKLWEKFNVTAAKGKAWLGENTQDEREPEQTALWRVGI
jgi:Domain of unknown function (DUF4942)